MRGDQQWLGHGTVAQGGRECHMQERKTDRHSPIGKLARPEIRAGVCFLWFPCRRTAPVFPLFSDLLGPSLQVFGESFNVFNVHVWLSKSPGTLWWRASHLNWSTALITGPPPHRPKEAAMSSSPGPWPWPCLERIKAKANQPGSRRVVGEQPRRPSPNPQPSPERERSGFDERVWKNNG